MWIRNFLVAQVIFIGTIEGSCSCRLLCWTRAGLSEEGWRIGEVLSFPLMQKTAQEVDFKFAH